MLIVPIGHNLPILDACPDPSPERFEIGFVATGHNQLAVPQVVKQIIPAGNIQLAHHIIEQHDWVFPNGLPDQLTFCQLERKHTAALLPLRAIGPRAFPVEGDFDVVPVRAADGDSCFYILAALVLQPVEKLPFDLRNPQPGFTGQGRDIMKIERLPFP